MNVIAETSSFFSERHENKKAINKFLAFLLNKKLHTRLMNPRSSQLVQERPCYNSTLGLRLIDKDYNFGEFDEKYEMWLQSFYKRKLAS